MRKKGSWVLYIYRWKSEEKEMSLLDIKELSLSFGDKILYKNAELSLFKGEHMGIAEMPNGDVLMNGCHCSSDWRNS